MDASVLSWHVQDLEALAQQEMTLPHEFSYAVYGYAAHFAASHSALLDIARISTGCFSRCEPVPNGRSIRLRFFLDPQLSAQPLPANLSSHLKYFFIGERLTVVAEPWVRAWGDMRDWSITAVVSPGAADAPAFLSRYICDNFVLHMMMRTGHAGHIGHLHASTLVREGKAVLLAGTHNSGKSTTALRLMLNGYRLVTDSTTFVRIWDEQGIELLGYPTGQLKLRLDMLDEFPLFRDYGQAMILRGETKMVLDLRRYMPAMMLEESVWPRKVVLCYMERRPNGAPLITVRACPDILERIWPESSFVDDPQVNPGNWLAVRRLLENTRCHELVLGPEVADIVEAINSL